MKVMQSYLSTMMHASMSAVQMRIMLTIVRRCRMLTYGMRYSKLLTEKIKTSSLNMEFAVSYKELLGKSHNYAALHAALAGMQDEWKIEWFNVSNNSWFYSSWVNNVEFNHSTGLVKFTSPAWLIDFITDCRKFGYREYDFELAWSLSNVNAARLYLITASQTKPFTFEIDGLKRVLGLQGKYDKMSAFERRILKPAQRELEKKNCNGFNYVVVREGNKKYGKPLKITFIPVKREKSLTDTQSRIEFLNEVPKLLTSYLSQRFDFTYVELSRSKAAFVAFSNLANYEEKFFEICERAARKNKNHGYIINAIKREAGLLQK